MPSFPEFNGAFDNAQGFVKPPAEHPYWTNKIVLMQEHGFSREFLVSLAELDQIQNGRLALRIRAAANDIKGMCAPPQQELEVGVDELEMEDERDLPVYEPEYIANALMRPLRTFSACSNEEFKGSNNLLEYLVVEEEIDELDFNIALFEAYHPDNRLIMPFHAGVRSDGTIIDAEGPSSQHPGFVDERGKLFDLRFMR